MLADARDQDGIYRPGPFWSGYAARIATALENEGLAGFRSSAAIGRGYCDVFNDDPAGALGGVPGRLYAAAKAIGVQRPIDTAWRGRDRVRQRQKDRRFTSTLGPWMRSFRARFDLPDTLVGNPQRRVSFSGEEIGELYLRDFAWVDDYGKRVDLAAVRSVFEIGGGFGSMAHTVLHLFPNIRKYLYVDIPPNLYVGTQYLRQFYPDAVLDYEHTRHRARITFSQNGEREIIALCPWQLERVEAEFDLFWNSTSFQEMTPEIVANYARHIARLMGRDGAVCLYVYAALPSSPTLSASQVSRLIEDRTSLHIATIDAPVASRIVPGWAGLGR